jgi:hypothetical protein
MNFFHYQFIICHYENFSSSHHNPLCPRIFVREFRELTRKIFSTISVIRGLV